MTVPRHSFAAYDSKAHYGSTGSIEYHEKGEYIGDCSYIQDGQYGIANNTRWAYQRFKSCKNENGEPLSDGGHFVAGKDHTGNKNGAMLIVNSEVGTGLPIFQQDIEFDLCDSREYKFVIYASSVTTYNEEGGNANLELKVVNMSTGEEVESIKTGDIPFWQFNGWGDQEGGRGDVTVQRKWTEFATQPFTVNNGDHLQLQVTNWGSGYNDFAIDDISLYRNDDVEIIDPTITSNTISSENKASAGSCIYNASFEVPESVLTNWQKVYDKVYFLWQSSKDDGLTWENRLEESGLNRITADFEVSAEVQEVYRVIITGSASETEAQEQALHIAQTGGPKDGCSYYSISNTLAGVSPTPDCTYQSDLRVLWSDDLGVIGESDKRAAPEVKLTLHNDDQTDISTGEYGIVSDPYLAFKNSGWEQEESLNDASGKLNGAMIYLRLDKSSGDDDQDLIYEKQFTGKLCPCKSMCFSFFAYDRLEWADETLVGRVLTDNDEVIGETTLSLNSKNALKWVQCSVPFNLPQSYKGTIRLQILNKTKQNSGVRIALDNLSLYICGEVAPQGAIQIDQYPTLAYLGGDNCKGNNNTLSISDDERWKKTIPDYGFAWQKSTDHGATWRYVSSDKKITHQNSSGGLTEYRVVFAETQEAAEQAAQNGTPDDPCILFSFSNRVGIECQTEPCKSPVFELEGEEKLSICSDRTEPVTIKVTQKENIPIEQMQWFSKPYDDTQWQSLSDETDSTLTLKDFKAGITDYLFLATNDTCQSDSIFFQLDVHGAIVLTPKDTTVCEGSDITLKAILSEESSQPTEYRWNNIPSTRDESLLSNVTRFQNVTLSATDGVCSSEVVTYHVAAETLFQPSWTTDEVTGCQDSSINFVFNYNFIDKDVFQKNHTSVWKIDDEVVGESFDFNYIFQKEDTLSNIITGEYCPAVVSKFAMHVILKPQLSLAADVEQLCQGDDLQLTASTQNTNQLIWHFISEDKDTDEIMEESDSDQMTLSAKESGYYYIATPKHPTCGTFYSDTLFVAVEQALDFDIKDFSGAICEGSELNITAEAVAGTATATQWFKNGASISSTLSFDDTPTEESTYTFTAQSQLCKPFNAEFKVVIDNPTTILLSASQTVVCEGDSIELNAEIGESKSLNWQYSVNGKDFTTFSQAVTSALVFKETTEERYYFRIANDYGLCGTFYSDTVEVKVKKRLNYQFKELPASICAGEEIELSATHLSGEASQVQWSRGVTPIGESLSLFDAPTEDATYEFKAVSEVCPTFTEQFTIAVENPSHTSLSTTQTLRCKGEVIPLEADLGETKKVKWQYSTNGKDFTTFSEALSDEEHFTAGDQPTLSFRLESESEGRCKTGYSNVVSVEVEQPVIITTEKSDWSLCEGTTIELSFEANLSDHNTISWRENGTSLSNTTAKLSITPTENTSYEVTIQGEACDPVSQPFTVTVEQQPILNLTLSQNQSCKGDPISLQLEAEHAKEFSWEVKRGEEGNFTALATNSDTELSLTAEENATYRVTVAGTSLCEGKASNEVTLEVEQPITVELPDKSTICEGEQITINAIITGHPKSIAWFKRDAEDDERVAYPAENKSFTASPAISTEYTIAYTSENCPGDEVSTLVEVEGLVDLALQLSDDSICGGAEVTLSTQYDDETRIVWEKKKGSQFVLVEQGASSLTLTAEETTDYRVSATSKAGCKATPAVATIYVFQPSELSLADQIICLGDSVKLSVTGVQNGAELSWFSDDDNYTNTLSTKQSITVNPRITTDYKVVALNGKCVNEVTATVTIVTPPVVQSCDEVSIGVYELNVESNSWPLTYDYGQGPTPSNRLEDVVYGRTYGITISNEQGCATTYSLETPLYDIVIPDYFVPENGNWVIENMERYPKSTVNIYDRSGKLLAKLKSDSDGWDGIYNGKPLPSTDYWYNMNVPEIRRQFTGHFTLIRGK